MTQLSNFASTVAGTTAKRTTSTGAATTILESLSKKGRSGGAVGRRILRQEGVRTKSISTLRRNRDRS
jgi:hypothetical protein